MPLLLTWINLIPAWIRDYILHNVWDELLHRWSLGMDKWFPLTLYRACDYLSIRQTMLVKGATGSVNTSSLKTVTRLTRSMSWLLMPWRRKEPVHQQSRHRPVSPRIFLLFRHQKACIFFQFWFSMCKTECLCSCQRTRLWDHLVDINVTIIMVPYHHRQSKQLIQDRQEVDGISVIILDMGSANERRRYNVTLPLIDWLHTHNLQTPDLEMLPKSVIVCQISNPNNGRQGKMAHWSRVE